MASSTTTRHTRLLGLALTTALIVSMMAVVPASAASGGSVYPAAASATVGKAFRMNLYRAGDFVGQTNLVQCVGASMQMMLNMMRPANDRTAERQLELQQLARHYSPRRNEAMNAVGHVRQRRGASSRGWAFGLTRLGYGRYQVTSAPTLAEAVEWAAIAMRRTGKPAGLLVWRG